ncbi:MAG: hypothetical protein PWQ22_1513 [Archaeoglobaceae archaeon]|nr:hypothetical protein [Archaeoglobaceae archaeon]MDK2877103.1 hypothetical protein [Archaeoglobaceae archaeon]
MLKTSSILNIALISSAMNLRSLSIILFAIGIIDSAYLLYEHYLLYSLPYCPIGCSPLLELPFPSFILPLLGLMWFLAGTFLFYLRKYKSLLMLWQITGVLGVVALIVYSVLIHYFCPYCYLAHACGLLLILISAKLTQ